MLSLGRLQVLCEVVNRGSFSAAAEALAYTQSAISQSVARLEAETGATLVVRDRRGVRPTAAGATLVAHAEAIFAQVEAAEADLAAVLGVRSRTAAGRLVPVRRGDADAAGRGPLPPGPSRRRADPGRGRAGGHRAATASRRVRSRAPVSVPGRARAARAPACAMSPCSRIRWRSRSPPTTRSSSKPALTLADLRNQQWVQTSAASTVRAARGALLPGRRLRALRRLRER